MEHLKIINLIANIFEHYQLQMSETQLKLVALDLRVKTISLRYLGPYLSVFLNSVSLGFILRHFILKVMAKWALAAVGIPSH